MMQYGCPYGGIRRDRRLLGFVTSKYHSAHGASFGLPRIFVSYWHSEEDDCGIPTSARGGPEIDDPGHSRESPTIAILLAVKTFSLEGIGVIIHNDVSASPAQIPEQTQPAWQNPWRISATLIEACL